MNRSILLILFLAFLSGSVYADGYPTSRRQDKVYIVLKDGTGIEGYTDLVKSSYDDYPVIKSAPKGSDVLPIVLENYSLTDSLWVDTVIVNYGDDFGLLSGVRHFKVSNIKNIFAVYDILPESSTRKDVNFEAYLTDAEYKLLLQGYTASMLSFGSNVGLFSLLSCNPRFTQLDLYLYCCMMDKDSGWEVHPVFDREGKDTFQKELEDFYFNKNTKKSTIIINTLKKCQSSWRTLASYLKDSQAILPEERMNSIAKLDSLANYCDIGIRTVTDLVKSKNFPTREEDIYKLDQKINSGILPHLYFPCKDGDQFDWSGYLLKKGIILKYLAWD